MAESQENERTERILKRKYADDIEALSDEEVRKRRQECRLERDYQGFLRRLLQTRLQILEAVLKTREAGEDVSIVDQLPTILAASPPRAPSRGAALHGRLPQEEVDRANSRIERLLGSAAFSDPTSLDDEQLGFVLAALGVEERRVSDTRRSVLGVLNKVEGEIRRRYKERPASS